MKARNASYKGDDMSGQFGFGIPLNNAGAARASVATSFSEGIYFRAGGLLAARPITDNPHEAGNPDALAWNRGWTVADDASPGTIDPLDAPGAAVDGLVVADT